MITRALSFFIIIIYFFKSINLWWVGLILNLVNSKGEYCNAKRQKIGERRDGGGGGIGRCLVASGLACAESRIFEA